MRGQQMNWEVIAFNLRDARHDIDDVLENLGHPDMTVGRLKASIEHILHHILFAWNARHVSNERYAAMREEDFASWSSMHNDLVPLGAKLGKKTSPVPRSGKFDRSRGSR